MRRIPEALATGRRARVLCPARRSMRRRNNFTKSSISMSPSQVIRTKCITYANLVANVYLWLISPTFSHVIGVKSRGEPNRAPGFSQSDRHAHVERRKPKSAHRRLPWPRVFPLNLVERSSWPTQGVRSKIRRDRDARSPSFYRFLPRARGALNRGGLAVRSGRMQRHRRARIRELHERLWLLETGTRRRQQRETERPRRG